MAKKKTGQPKSSNVQQSPPDNPPQQAGGPPEKKKYRIKNVRRAGTSVYGVSGKSVEFDEEGIAVVPKAEFEHFLKVPGYTEA